MTPLLQPVAQGIIETLEKLYRKILLRRLLFCDGDRDDVLSFYANSEGCDYMLADSWSSVKAETLHKAWRKLFGNVLMSLNKQVECNFLKLFTTFRVDSKK
jgi:hypothetical protein